MKVATTPELRAIEAVDDAGSLEEMQSPIQIYLEGTYSTSDSMTIAGLVGVVRQTLQSIQAGSVRVCITLVRLRELVGADKTWTTFCKQNFPTMSSGNIRSAVSAGRKIIEYQARNPTVKPQEALAHLKMGALTALGHADDKIVDQVFELAESGQAVTASDIQDLKAQLAELRDTNNQLSQDNKAIQEAQNAELLGAKLEASEGKLQLARLSGTLSDLQDQLSALAQENAVLEERMAEAQRAPKVQVDALDNRAETVAKELLDLEHIRKEVQDIQTRRDTLSAQVLETSKKLDQTNQQIALATKATASIDTLAKEIDSLHARWTAVHIANLRQASALAPDALDALALQLRNLADLISTTTTAPTATTTEANAK